MSKRPTVFIALLLGGIVLVAWQAVRRPEPVYQGRALSLWLRQMECRPGRAESVQAANAREAIVKIGTPAVPHLVSIVHQSGPGFFPRYRRFFHQQIVKCPPYVIRWLPIPLDYPYQMQINAAGALASIGSPTNIVLPELLSVLRHPHTPLREVAAAELSRLGKEAVPALTEALRDPAPQVRLAAARSLWKVGSETTNWLSGLVGLLVSTNYSCEIRFRAAQALREMGPQAQPAVAALNHALQDPENFVRYGAAQALGSIGPAANPAIPALIQALQEHQLAAPPGAVEFGGNWQVCSAAAAALGQIGSAPETVIPALTEILRSPRKEIVIAGCEALAQFGPRAKPAVPTLLGFPREADGQVRTAAYESLLKIDPEAAARLLHGNASQ